MVRRILVGTAGWSIPKGSPDGFEGDGTHLERYARRLPCVEINSCFYRPHALQTYERWAAATPDHFRFAVKLPRLSVNETSWMPRPDWGWRNVSPVTSSTSSRSRAVLTIGATAGGGPPRYSGW